MEYPTPVEIKVRLVVESVRAAPVGVVPPPEPEPVEPEAFNPEPQPIAAAARAENRAIAAAGRTPRRSTGIDLTKPELNTNITSRPQLRSTALSRYYRR